MNLQGRSVVLGETLRQREAILELAAFFRLNRSDNVPLRAVARRQTYVNDTLVMHLQGQATTLALHCWRLGSE